MPTIPTMMTTQSGLNPTGTPMDLVSILYSFVLALGTGQFVVNDAQELSPTTIEVDLETLGLRENKRFILLVENGKITQQARVPLTSVECVNPH